MTVSRARTEEIRQFVVGHLDEHPHDIVALTAEHFGLSRQAVTKHLRSMAAEGLVTPYGKTRGRLYGLATIQDWRRDFPLEKGLTEDVAWREVAAVLGKVSVNAKAIWHYGITEMFNNAIDHSGGTSARVRVRKTAGTAQIDIIDDGVGIFHKIQTALGLLDERHAVLELAKGKFTTDPTRHSGEGIFFSSRMFDRYTIFSGNVYFACEAGNASEVILERPGEKIIKGTMVTMKLSHRSTREIQAVFDQFTTPDSFGFSKTIVPVKLAQYGDDNLVSRSQARRLLARIDRFRTVLLDFSGVESAGQAFCDEIFRVFASEHPKVNIRTSNANRQVAKMIAHVTGRPK
jgi:anti-sigma regulatory factor (Ser/Thr protein kinase)